MMFYSAVGVSLKVSTGAAETRSNMMIVSAAAEAHFVFCCQFTEQEKKLMEATTEFHQKVNRPNKSDYQRAPIRSVC